MTPMDLFGLRADSERMQAMFAHFNTLRRPELAERHTYHDWVLVRRAGVELGFTEEHYQRGDLPVLWGNGALLFTQVYFYAGFDEVARYCGALPFGIGWSDTREQVRQRMGELAATLHSSDVSDAWDTNGYRITVHYSGPTPQRPDKLACLQAAKRLGLPPAQRRTPSLQWLAQQWGASVAAQPWRQAFGAHLNDDALAQGLEDGVIDLSVDLGVDLHVQNDAGTLLLRAVSVFGQAYEGATQWLGDLPFGLSFDDSPHVLFAKLKAEPDKRQDGELSGFAVWHTQDFSLHVLYSFVDNRILRIKLLAPGTWKSAMD